MTERQNGSNGAAVASSSRSTRLAMACGSLLAWLAIRLLQASWRPAPVAGQPYFDRLCDQGRPMLPCCWHQRLVFSASWLLTRDAPNFQPGFLVSPSRDGEMVARVVRHSGARVLRGSATRTGARALRDMYAAITAGVSPIMPADGPHGPAFESKPGSLLLAQMAHVPLLPMAFAADRYWQIGSWDRLIIPKPFARVYLVIGMPLHVDRHDDAAACRQALDAALDEATRAADHAGARRR